MYPFGLLLVWCLTAWTVLADVEFVVTGTTQPQSVPVPQCGYTVGTSNVFRVSLSSNPTPGTQGTSNVVWAPAGTGNLFASASGTNLTGTFTEGPQAQIVLSAAQLLVRTGSGGSTSASGLVAPDGSAVLFLALGLQPNTAIPLPTTTVTDAVTFFQQYIGVVGSGLVSLRCGQTGTVSFQGTFTIRGTQPPVVITPPTPTVPVTPSTTAQIVQVVNKAGRALVYATPNGVAVFIPSTLQTSFTFNLPASNSLVNVDTGTMTVGSFAANVNTVIVICLPITTENLALLYSDGWSATVLNSGRPIILICFFEQLDAAGTVVTNAPLGVSVLYSPMPSTISGELWSSNTEVVAVSITQTSDTAAMTLPHTSALILYAGVSLSASPSPQPSSTQSGEESQFALLGLLGLLAIPALCVCVLLPLWWWSGKQEELAFWAEVEEQNRERQQQQQRQQQRRYSNNTPAATPYFIEEAGTPSYLYYP